MVKNRYTREPEITPFEPEAYVVAIFFFVFLLLVSFLGSSYLNRYPDTPIIQQIIED